MSMAPSTTQLDACGTGDAYLGRCARNKLPPMLTTPPASEVLPALSVSTTRQAQARLQGQGVLLEGTQELALSLPAGTAGRPSPRRR